MTRHFTIETIGNHKDHFGRRLNGNYSPFGNTRHTTKENDFAGSMIARKFQFNSVFSCLSRSQHLGEQKYKLCIDLAIWYNMEK